MTRELESVIKELQDLENRFNIIFKIELFTDMTGTVYYLVDTQNIDWKYAFAFSDLLEFKSELRRLEEKL